MPLLNFRRSEIDSGAFWTLFQHCKARVQTEVQTAICYCLEGAVAPRCHHFASGLASERRSADQRGKLWARGSQYSSFGLREGT